MALKKESPFNLEQQQDNVDNKIIVALEKITEAFRVLQWQEAQEHKISPIQLQILIFIQHHTTDKCKVGYLAKELNVTKATVSDSVKTLLKKELLSKLTDQNDTRSFTLSLTKNGVGLVQKIEHYTDEIKLPLLNLDSSKKEILFDSLTELIYKLQQNGIIAIQRMCYTCDHYEGDKSANHYCNLMKTELKQEKLRLDCPEHLEIVR